MSQVELSFAELHNPLFLAGKNHGMKLDPGKTGNLKLFYDRQEKELLVHYNDEIGIVPSSNVACMVIGAPKKPFSQIVHPIVAGIQSAQVQTPTGHVHQGPGHGKSR